MFKDAYVWLEKRFFNSITKKITGNVLLLAVMAATAGRLSAVQGLTVAMVPLGLGATVFTIFFLRHLIYHPVSEMIRRLRELTDGNADLTKELVVTNYDEIRTLAQSYNDFLKYLGEIIAKMQITSNEVNESIIVLSNETSVSAKNSNKLLELSDQTATAVEELSQTITQIIRNTSETSAVTDRSMEIAVKGNDVAADAVDAVSKLQSSTVELSGMFEELNRKTNEIGNIVTVIKDIADQTNLLALNAAIEAARAGEQGRGFAVVADEVRKLAERTIRATAEISEKIGAVQAETEKTSSSMGDSLSEVKKATDYIRQVGDSLQEIVHTSQDVHRQMEQVTISVTQQGTATEEIAGNAQSSKNFAEDMADISKVTNTEIVKVRKSSRNIIEALTGIRVDRSPEILIEKGKADIHSFVVRMDNHFEGSEKLDLAILADHRNSRFGKWYYNEGNDDFGQCNDFRMIDGPLAVLHAKAVDAVKHFNEGRTDFAEKSRAEAKGTSERIMKLLDGLHSDAVAKRYKYSFVS